MNFFQTLLIYKVFGASSLILASIYIIIFNINDIQIYQHIIWALIILLLGLIQLYDSYILNIYPKIQQEKDVKEKNEVKPLLKEEYPVIKLRIKELREFNRELNDLKKDGSQKGKKLLNNLKDEMHNALKIEN